ncbi:DUF1624 domain-containing protein [Lampropedia puyangensis]|uniref:DUF1624 domain-containing protein n=1 Tax=Lampropedia puyangensis TaxID=1330072 RepID=A0A4S8EYG4_9BURK|nr:DUF1624 domain-containing protein [Lampropedia puyangensis]THT98713.1 DUF1624 domain-containing protein [Lampropedia puyangensis]
MTANPPSPQTAQKPAVRLQSIDALRGFVIVLMLLDHVRETFFLHMQVNDPMDVTTTAPGLFFSRLLAHLCAPIFVFLTGLSAYLYASKYVHSQQAASAFLFKRGLFLIVLEFTLVNFAWTFSFPPSTIYMQVIWAIGISMVILSVLLWLPRSILMVLGLIIIAGHNLLDSVHFDESGWMHIPWAVLHDRGWLQVTDGLRMRTSYPVLPWIGVISLGYSLGPWFGQDVTFAQRQKSLLKLGIALLCSFVALRAFNSYGDKPWVEAESSLISLMGFLNITKYPPSLLFIMLTLGLGLLLLWKLGRLQDRFQGHLPGALAWLCTFGAAPMFFYLLHLYVLKLMYLTCVSILGKNQGGTYFGVNSVLSIWLITLVLVSALYWPVKAFARFKAQRRDITWLKYL